MGLPIDVPRAIASLTVGLQTSAVGIGMSSARVERLDRDGVPIYYLKTGPRPRSGSLLAERDILAWLDRRLGTPRVAAWAAKGPGDYLLGTAVPGADAAQPAPGILPTQAADAMAHALRGIHQLSIEGCPAECPVAAILTAAQNNVAEGLVDASRFDAERRGRTPEDLLAEALGTRPLDPPRLVFTHGDPSVPNFIMRGAAVSGIVDWAWAGLADPYSDLAIAARSMARNYGPDLVAPFFTAYGLDEPDEERLAFFSLESEFF